MTPPTLHQITTIIEHQFDKVARSSLLSWLASTGVAIFQVLVHDAFFWLWWTLLILNAGDWIAGRLAARSRNDFDTKRSREGLYSKGLGLVIMLGLRSLEAIAPGLPGVHLDTHGIGASMICFLLTIEDLASLERHRLEMGGAPIPLLTQFIRAAQSATGGDRRLTPRQNEPRD